MNLPQPHCFENIVYSGFRHYLRHDAYEIQNLKGIKFWLEMLYSAEDKKYPRFKQRVIIHVIERTVESIASGSIDYENGIELLKRLIPQ